MKEVHLKEELEQAQKTICGLKRQLHSAHDELEKTNSELLQLTLELEDRVADRTIALQQLNESLREQIAERKRAEEHLRGTLEKLKQSQSQLIQAEKMSALGTLTAGVAHELNNPMMGILNFVQYCFKHSSMDDKRYVVLEDAERETKRCIDIVGNLLTFSGTEPWDAEQYGKESCVLIFDRVFRLLSYRIDKDTISIAQHIAKRTPKIWMKVSHMQQAFLNLIANALDSLNGSKKKEVRVDICSQDEFVRVTVSDSGCGIAPENLTKIFDPFFTTKPPGKGTGLGLSVCRSIVKSHGGEIVCESEVGMGSKFKVLLPVEREI